MPERIETKHESFTWPPEPSIRRLQHPIYRLFATTIYIFIHSYFFLEIKLLIADKTPHTAPFYHLQYIFSHRINFLRHVERWDFFKWLTTHFSNKLISSFPIILNKEFFIWKITLCVWNVNCQAWKLLSKSLLSTGLKDLSKQLDIISGKEIQNE